MSPNMVPFHRLRMGSYYCAITTLHVRRTVFFLEIRLQKYRDLENWVQGP